MKIILERGRTEKYYWHDLWRFRELFRVLSWRDVAVRYKQTVLGVAWAVVRPLATTVILTVVFGRLAGLPSEGAAPYPLMVFTGMLPWFLFSAILGEGSGSLVANANLVAKVYFPRLIIPLSVVITALVDFGINLVILGLMMTWYGFVPGWKVVFLPGFIAMVVLASAGPALFMTALNVKYRDFRYLVPFILQFGLYISPVGFSSDIVPPPWRLWYGLNPLVGAIDGFRWCLTGGELHPGALLLSLAVISVLCWAGVTYFRRTERAFADLI